MNSAFPRRRGEGCNSILVKQQQTSLTFTGLWASFGARVSNTPNPAEGLPAPYGEATGCQVASFIELIICCPFITLLSLIL